MDKAVDRVPLQELFSLYGRNVYARIFDKTQDTELTKAVVLSTFRAVGSSIPRGQDADHSLRLLHAYADAELDRLMSPGFDDPIRQIWDELAQDDEDVPAAAETEALMEAAVEEPIEELIAEPVQVQEEEDAQAPAEEAAQPPVIPDPPVQDPAPAPRPWPPVRDEEDNEMIFQPVPRPSAPKEYHPTAELAANPDPEPIPEREPVPAPKPRPEAPYIPISGAGRAASRPADPPKRRLWKPVCITLVLALALWGGAWYLMEEGLIPSVDLGYQWVRETLWPLLTQR